MKSLENIIQDDKKIRQLILSAEHNNGDLSRVKSIIKLQNKLLKLGEPKNKAEQVLNDYPYIFAYEWHVFTRMSQYGVGDLVFTDDIGNYLVMEVKELSSSSGRNQCVKRRKARRKVEAQALFYTSAFKNKCPEAKSVIGVAVASNEWKFYFN